MPEETKPENNFEEEKGSSNKGAGSPAFRRGKFLKFALIFFVIILIGGAAVFAASYFLTSKKPAQVSAPKPDEIVITKLPDGNQLVENKTQGYAATIPEDLTPQLTNNLGNGALILAASSSSLCNYSISKIPNNNNVNLETWFNNLYSDMVTIQSFKNLTIANHKAIEVVISTPRPSKTIYISSQNNIYGFSYYPLISSCDNNLTDIINSFKYE